MRAISDLLRSPYWRNRGLDVHFVADWAAQAWSDAGCPAPHSLVRITYGPPSEVAPSKREAERGIVGPQSSAAHTLPGEHAALDDLKSGSRPAFCSACRKPVDVRDPGSFLVCPARDCPEPASHLTCLAQKFLEKPFGYSDPNAVVPGAGHCPSCGTMARWADLVLAMRRRVGFAPASRKKVKASTGAAVNEESESEDEELDEDSDSDDEDSGSQRSLASSSETISYRAAIPDIRLPAISAASKHSRAESELVKGLDNLAVSDRLPPLPSATGTGARKAIGATRKHILSAQMAAYSVSNAADVDRGSLKAVERTEMEPADLRKERKKANTSEVHRKESSGAKGKAWNPGRDPTLEVSRETETETAESSLRREPDYSSMIGKVAIETRKPAVIPQKDPTFLDKEGSSSPHSDDFHSANENTDCDSDSDSDDDALKRLRGLLDKLRTEDK